MHQQAEKEKGHVMSRVVGWSTAFVTLLGLTAAVSLGRGETAVSGQDQEPAVTIVALLVEGMT